MPKVTPDYTATKKSLILDCAHEVFREKPLYQITMRDIIAKTGFSQGTIYRYYANVDEIFLDAVNAYTPARSLEARLADLIASGITAGGAVYGCMTAMGGYIEELQQTVGGKMLFGLLVLYAFDRQKQESLIARLQFRQNLEAAQLLIIGYIGQQIDKGIFRPVIPLEAIIRFTQASIDGISTSTAIQSMESSGSTCISEMFETLAKSVLYFLGAKEE
ncbi:MAG: transcriptional regulator, TetR family [Paenibacillaceae bacterium]|jgi:AcrR family transcriptional regulator|nr:transcriptional regulator, TetR family [Paenibacillaceae bacterium]